MDISIPEILTNVKKFPGIPTNGKFRNPKFPGKFPVQTFREEILHKVKSKSSLLSFDSSSMFISIDEIALKSPFVVAFRQPCLLIFDWSFSHPFFDGDETRTNLTGGRRQQLNITKFSLISYTRMTVQPQRLLPVVS